VRVSSVVRRDRRDGFGGVLIAVKADIVSEHLDVKINTESVYTSITLETIIISGL
jgi:hypothetical protein